MQIAVGNLELRYHDPVDLGVFSGRTLTERSNCLTIWALSRYPMPLMVTGCTRNRDDEV